MSNCAYSKNGPFRYKNPGVLENLLLLFLIQKSFQRFCRPPCPSPKHAKHGHCCRQSMPTRKKNVIELIKISTDLTNAVTRLSKIMIN